MKIDDKNKCWDWIGTLRKVPFEKQRKELQKIESQVRNILGGNPEIISHHDVVDSKKELDILMFKRYLLLNTMYLATPEEYERMRIVNDRLYELTSQLREAVRDVCDGLINTPRDSFTHDYEVMGTIHFVFDDKESVLSMIIDEKYGSDYQYMMAVQDLLLDVDDRQFEMLCRYDDPKDSLLEDLDDFESWEHEIPIKDSFDGICICHTCAVFVRDLQYPVFDLLHMNDFWSEVEVRYQNFAKLNI